MELPSHPQSDNADRGRDRGNTVNWGTVVVIATLGVLLATVVILHLIGVVGPAGR